MSDRGKKRSHSEAVDDDGGIGGGGGGERGDAGLGAAPPASQDAAVPVAAASARTGGGSRNVHFLSRGGESDQLLKKEDPPIEEECSEMQPKKEKNDTTERPSPAVRGNGGRGTDDARPSKVQKAKDDAGGDTHTGGSIPPLVCGGCNEAKDRAEFSKNQRNKVAAARRCRTCLGQDLKCHGGCNKMKARYCFSVEEKQRKPTSGRRCRDCVSSQNNDAERPGAAIPRLLPMLCASCKEEKEITEFSKTQIGLKSKRRCRSCILLAQCEKKQSELQKKEKAALVNAANPTKLLRCKSCKEEKAMHDFCKEQRSEDERHCRRCMKKLSKLKPSLVKTAKGLGCAVCEEVKERAEFSSKQQGASKGTRRCRLCILNGLTVEKRKQLARLQRGIGFYDFDIRKLQWAKEKPNNLAGVYDIIYQLGAGEEQYETRTTKGTATIVEECSDDGRNLVSGTVKVNKELEMCADERFPRDFALAHGIHDVSANSWSCEFDNVTLNEEDNLYFLDWDLLEPSARVTCVAERAGFGWMEEERENWMDEGDDDAFIRFESLEEAEALVHSHGGGLKESNVWLVKQRSVGDAIQQLSKPVELTDVLARKIQSYVLEPPVFFVEPGDLILTTRWDDGILTEHILRRRK
jgi:Stc1 domain